MADTGGLGLAPQAMTPEEAAANRQAMWAQSLLQQGGQTAPVLSPWAAAARAVQGALGGYEMRDAQQQMINLAQQGRDLAAQARLAGGGPMVIPQPGQGTGLAAPGAGGAPPPAGGSTTRPVAPQATTMPTQFQPMVGAASTRTGVPVPVLTAVFQQESSWNPDLTGGAKEIGLGQIKPSTAQSPGYGLTGVDPQTLTGAANAGNNIDFSANYLAAIAKSQGLTNWNDPAQVAKVLRAYNGGGDPNYVANVYRYTGDHFGDAVKPYLVATSSTQPAGAPSGATPAPGTMGGLNLQDQQTAAAQYGAQRAQQLYLQGVQNMRSPYREVQQVGQQQIAQAQQFAQMGRFRMAGTLAGGQPVFVDLMTGKPEALGAEVRLYKDDQNNLRNPQGQIVAQGNQGIVNALTQSMRDGSATPEQRVYYEQAFNQLYPSHWETDPDGKSRRVFANPNIPGNIFIPGTYPGAPTGGGAGGVSLLPTGGVGGFRAPQPDVQQANRLGVPLPSTNYYGNMSSEAGALAKKKDQDTYTDMLAKDEDPMVAATPDKVRALNRMDQLSSSINAGPGWQEALSRMGSTFWTTQQGKDLMEFRNLQAQLTPSQRIGSGIQRVTNMDMGMFSQMVPNEQNPPSVNRQIIQNQLAIYDRLQQHNRFLHDYIAVNGSPMEAEHAWDQYTAANQPVVQDKNGQWVKNNAAVDYRTWFRKNTDPSTGQLREPGAAAPAAAQPQAGAQMPAGSRLPPEGQFITQGGVRYQITNGVPVQVP